MRAIGHTASRTTGMLLMMLGAGGCVGKSTDALDPVLPPDTTIGYVTASPGVMILAVGGTQQLSFTALSLTGAPLTTFDSVQYLLNSAADSLRARVGNTGLITALAPSNATVLVNTHVWKDNTAAGDQVLLKVTTTAIPGLTLSIQPVAPDSAKLAIGSAKTITPILMNPTTGAFVANPAIDYRVNAADATRVGVYRPTIRTPGSGVITEQWARQPAAAANQIVAQVNTGSAWIYATINAYGTVLRDSVLYNFSNPYTQTVTTVKNMLDVRSTLAYQVEALAPGATVTFTNGVAATDPLQIVYTFDNPAAVTAASPPATIGGTSGNITPLSGTQSSTRRFLMPGTYTWTATAVGGPAPWSGRTLSGTIVIK